MNEFGAICAGGGLAALMLTAAHLALWEKRDGLWLVWRYTIGVGCLNAGISLAGALLADWRLAVIPWCVAVVGGTAVAVLHLWRERKVSPALVALMRRANKEYSRARAGTTGGSDAGEDR